MIAIIALGHDSGRVRSIGIRAGLHHTRVARRRREPGRPDTSRRQFTHPATAATLASTFLLQQIQRTALRQNTTTQMSLTEMKRAIAPPKLQAMTAPKTRNTPDPTLCLGVMT
jgi:hypothetical protein